MMYLYIKYNIRFNSKLNIEYEINFMASTRTNSYINVDLMTVQMK